jgi:SAM-dependent methyltransferase
MAPDLLETTPCPLCDGTDREHAPFKVEPFSLARCKKCGLWYLSVRPAETFMLKTYTDNAYFKNGDMGYTNYHEQKTALQSTFKRFLRLLNKQYPLHGKLLEIGCGFGYLLDEAKTFFNSRTGTEYSSEAVAAARAHADMVYCGGIDLLPEDEQYDCIILTQVIEHIYRPLEFLNKLSRKLKKGGVIAVATVNIDGFWFKIMGKKWPSLKIPEHVIFLTGQTLVDALKKAGCAQVTLIPFLHAFPIKLVGEKLGLRIPRFISTFTIWIPGTCLAAAGKMPG